MRVLLLSLSFPFSPTLPYTTLFRSQIIHHRLRQIEKLPALRIHLGSLERHFRGGPTRSADGNGIGPASRPTRPEPNQSTTEPAAKSSAASPESAATIVLTEIELRAAA